MPSTLSPIAQTYWKRIVRLLSKRRTLTAADSCVLEILSEEYSRWQGCLKDIELNGPMTIEQAKDGTTKRVQNPAAKMAAQLEVSMRLLLKELSATPASREKTKQAAPDPTKQPPREGTAAWYEANAHLFAPSTQQEKIAEPMAIEFSDSDVDFDVEEKIAK